VNHDSCPRSLNAVFELLVAERRRNAMYALRRRAEPISVAELADEVTPDEATEPDAVAATLHHVHLPKLAEAGVVTYDIDAGTVELLNLPRRLERYLDFAAADEHATLVRRAPDDARLSEF
jgi:DNA-binding transcriptional ArsR family regulator